MENVDLPAAMKTTIWIYGWLNVYPVSQDANNALDLSSQNVLILTKPNCLQSLPPPTKPQPNVIIVVKCAQFSEKDLITLVLCVKMVDNCKNNTEKNLVNVINYPIYIHI